MPALIFVFAVLGLSAFYASGVLATVLWILFYALLLFVLGSMILHAIWHLMETEWSLVTPDSFFETITLEDDYEHDQEYPTRARVLSGGYRFA